MWGRVLYPVDEAREILGGMSRGRFYVLVGCGAIRLVKNGRRSLVPAAEIERLLLALGTDLPVAPLVRGASRRGR